MQKRINKIEDFADEFLQSYYTSHHSGSSLLIRKGEKTRKGVKVDALITFKHPKGSLFTATLTTAHSAKLSALLTDYKKKGLSKFRFLTALVLLIATTYLVSLALHWGIAAGVAFVTALAGFILHTVAEKQALRKKINSILNTMQRYHANNQWLGISISSLTFRNNPLAAYFLSLCQERGVGVITVGQRGKVVLMQEPQTVELHENDFLAEYTEGEKIRNTFTNPTLKVA
ncbi:MnhB domain-containing protein [Botryobacter ruber]|uniref:MnhB domain-containing protein n=1 Tax=Botryobacter ruber TaxID=2171629 RepID=UPI000E0B786F|nr:MnhB domain-containing protein [Botryobacter ruber]